MRTYLENKDIVLFIEELENSKIFYDYSCFSHELIIGWPTNKKDCSRFQKFSGNNFFDCMKKFKQYIKENEEANLLYKSLIIKK